MRGPADVPLILLRVFVSALRAAVIPVVYVVSRRTLAVARPQ